LLLRGDVAGDADHADDAIVGVPIGPLGRLQDTPVAVDVEGIFAVQQVTVGDDLTVCLHQFQGHVSGEQRAIVLTQAFGQRFPDQARARRVEQ
jgi:hypothetical protein